MNVVLFEPDEIDRPLAIDDPRGQHILRVLRRQPGESFDAGVVNGALGTGTLLAVEPSALTFVFAPRALPPPLPPVTLLVGLPRPQTARDILRDATTLGVSCLHFVSTERSDRGYTQSRLWTDGEWRRHVIAGAAQAFDTRIPEVTWTHSLEDALRRLGRVGLPPSSTSRPQSGGEEVWGGCTLLALDNYEAETRFPAGVRSVAPAAFPSPPQGRGAEGRGDEAAITLAIGPERGWGPADRGVLRAAGATLHHLGPRVLRVETAAVAALTLLSSWRAC